MLLGVHIYFVAECSEVCLVLISMCGSDSSRWIKESDSSRLSDSEVKRISRLMSFTPTTDSAFLMRLFSQFASIRYCSSSQHDHQHALEQFDEGMHLQVWGYDLSHKWWEHGVWCACKLLKCVLKSGEWPNECGGRYKQLKWVWA